LIARPGGVILPAKQREAFRMSESESRGIPYGSIGTVLFCAVALVLQVLLFLGFWETLNRYAPMP
jgi:hypothetical protein